MKRKTLFLMLLISLLVSLILSAAPSNEIWLSPAKESSVLKANFSLATYENETVHQGDLIINGTKTYLIENCRFTQIGNIRIEDQATLLIRNAEFYMNKSGSERFSVECFSESKLIIIDSRVSSMYPIWLYDRAELNFNRTEAVGLVIFDLSVGLLQFTDCQLGNGFIDVPFGEIIVKNSTCGYIEGFAEANILIFDSSIQKVGIGFWQANVSVNQKNFKGEIEITHFNTFSNLTIYEGEAPNITIENSNIEQGIGLKFGRSIGKISESTLIFAAIYSSSNVEILKSELDSVNVRESEALIVNTTLNDEVFVETSKVLIIDTDLPSTEIQGGSEVFIDNSIIEDIRTFGVNITICLTDSVLKTSWFINKAQIYIYGNFSFSDDFRLGIYGNVTRNFNLFVLNRTDYPLENVTLNLYDEENNLIWQGTTDSFGRANFNLTFSRENQTANFFLKAFKGNWSKTRQISFLSATPILIRKGYLTDLNNDGKVNIIDLTIVAKAFGTKPGDKNWNAVADLDKNGVINIKDIAMVARDFGKTD